MEDKDFKKLEKSYADLEEEKEKNQELFLTTYRNIIDILKEYLDMKEEYYNIIALWIMGTYFHQKFPSYPYLFFNAMKGSGKSRTINLISTLAKDGKVLNSLTEAVLFRTNGTLAIDEYEGVGRKGAENLRELLNSAYKRGTKVIRFKKGFTKSGEEQVKEEFEVYRPITLANIWGMENVLGDRCITIVLEKSDNKEVTNRMEIWGEEEIVKETIKMLNQCSLCSVMFSTNTYREWNTFITHNYTYYTNNTNNTNYTNYTQTFKSIKSMDLNGRDLELSFPLCLMASQISPDLLNITTLTLKSIFEAKKEEEIIENTDISLYDFFASTLDSSELQSVKELTNKFRNFLETDDPDINPKWMGKALKRLGLLIEKKRHSRGTLVKVNYPKAREKIKMFK